MEFVSELLYDLYNHQINLLGTLMSLINVQSLMTVQGDELSKKNYNNKRTDRKSSSISVQ